jgi:hypothetical protein
MSALRSSPQPSLRGAQDRLCFEAQRFSLREVVLIIEGDDVELHTRQWFDDPVLSTPFSSWLPLFEGPLHAVREVATWEWRAA